MKAMDPKQAKDWFGATPPDLTLRLSRADGAKGSGADLYTYMRTFTATSPRLRAGTTWPSRAFACRMCCGSCKGAKAVRGKADPHATRQDHAVFFAGFEQTKPDGS